MRVLIVDDNSDVAESLAELCRIAGCEDVAIAGNAAAALAHLRARGADIVLCDLTLPGGMSGLDLAQACRRDPAIGAGRLVAISGYSGAEDRDRAYSAGFDEFVAKPVSYDTLSGMLSC